MHSATLHINLGQSSLSRANCTLYACPGPTVMTYNDNCLEFPFNDDIVGNKNV